MSLKHQGRRKKDRKERKHTFIVGVLVQIERKKEIHLKMNNYIENINMSTTEERIFKPKVEHILNVLLVAKKKNNDTRQMLVVNDTLDKKLFKQMDTKHVYIMIRDVIGATTKLLNHKAKRVVKMIEYIRCHEANFGDNDLIGDPSEWDINDSNKWKWDDKPKNNNITPTTVVQQPEPPPQQHP